MARLPSHLGICVSGIDPQQMALFNTHWKETMATGTCCRQEKPTKHKQRNEDEGFRQEGREPISNSADEFYATRFSEIF